MRVVSAALLYTSKVVEPPESWMLVSAKTRVPAELMVRFPEALLMEWAAPPRLTMLPEELTWNWDEEPTEKREVGEVLPIPTLPET